MGSQVLDLTWGRFRFLAVGPLDGDAVKPYPSADEFLRPVLRVAMPRVPRLQAPGEEYRIKHLPRAAKLALVQSGVRNARRGR